MCSYNTSFCFALFCQASTLTHSILFYSIPFHSIPFHSILFYSILFYSILFYSILFYSILFYSILLYYILNCIVLYVLYCIVCNIVHYFYIKFLYRMDHHSNQISELASFPTKSTPVRCLHFTWRNLLLSAGPFARWLFQGKRTTPWLYNIILGRTSYRNDHHLQELTSKDSLKPSALHPRPRRKVQNSCHQKWSESLRRFV